MCQAHHCYCLAVVILENDAVFPALMLVSAVGLAVSCFPQDLHYLTLVRLDYHDAPAKTISLPPVGLSRCNYCGSIPLAKALGINIRVSRAEAVLFLKFTLDN